MVIEHPTAVASWARLQSLPGAVDHRARRDREDGSDRRVDASGGAGNEPWAVRLEANLGARPLGRSPHGCDRAHVQDLIVVGERQRAQSLANGQGAIEIVPGEALS